VTKREGMGDVKGEMGGKAMNADVTGGVWLAEMS
jgi:hypothetical protein